MSKFISRRKIEGERRWKEERRELVNGRGKCIKFNLNQLSFYRRRAYLGHVSSKARHLHLTTSLSLSFHLSFSLSFLHSRRLYVLSFRPRCLFTFRLYYFCRAQPRVRYLFRSNDRSSRQSISSRMRLECLERPGQIQTPRCPRHDLWLQDIW